MTDDVGRHARINPPPARRGPTAGTATLERTAPPSRAPIEMIPAARRPDHDDERLALMLERFAQLDDDDPERARVRDRLARDHSPVVTRIASRYRNRGEPIDDLIQAGTLGLLNAIDRYDPSRRSAFLAYAVPTITGEIRRHFRDHTWSVHVPRRMRDLQGRMGNAQELLGRELGRAPRVSELAAHLAVSREDVIDALAAQHAHTPSSLDAPAGESHTTVTELVGDPDIRFDLVDARESLRPAIERLHERERTILTLRFFDEMTQTEIAQQLGLSQMHISRLLARILSDLRHHVLS